MTAPGSEARGAVPQRPSTFLVFGATGATGRHFLDLALADGNRVKALARTPGKLPSHPNLEAHEGSVPDVPDLDSLLSGVDFVVAMLGDREQQMTRRISDEFVRALIPAMRRQHVTRFLYQAGGLSAAPGRGLPPALRAIRHTIGRPYRGQHQDNEAVMRYLVDEADDIAWIVHRAGIGSDGPARGTLHRSAERYSVATFRDAASYNYRAVQDESAIHTCDFSTYSTADRRHRRDPALDA